MPPRAASKIPEGILRPAERMSEKRLLYILLSINSGVLIDYFWECNHEDTKNTKKRGKRQSFGSDSPEDWNSQDGTGRG